MLTHKFLPLLFILPLLSVCKENGGPVAAPGQYQPQTNFSVHEHAAIDSLLFCGDFVAAQQAVDQAFAHVDTVHTEKTKLKSIKNGLNKYYQLLKQLSLNASSPDSNSQTAILETALSVGSRFQADAAGELGNRAYRLFQKAWSVHQIKPALDYYTLAQFYRVQFFEQSETYLTASVDSVAKNISAKQYHVALSQINALSSTEASNPAFFKFSQALAEAKRKAVDGIEAEERQQDLYSQTEPFTMNWGFSIGVGSLSIGEITNSRWAFVNDMTSKKMDSRFSIRSIVAVPSLLWQAGASYYFNSQLSCDLRGAFSRVHFTQARVDDEYIPSAVLKKAETSASFHHDLYDLEATMHYYLQKELGVRVYLAGGVGYSLMRRGQTQNPIGTYFLDSLSMTQWSRYSSLQESEGSMYAVARVGTDYVNDASTFLVGAFIEENIYLKPVHLANAYATTLGIKYGLIF